MTLNELAHRQRHFGHQDALLAEGDLECLSDLCHAVGVIGDEGQDRNLLLITLPESHAFGDGEPIEAGADLLTNEAGHHRLGHRARIGDVATEEQLELHSGVSLSTPIVWQGVTASATPLVPLTQLSHGIGGFFQLNPIIFEPFFIITLTNLSDKFFLTVFVILLDQRIKYELLHRFHVHRVHHELSILLNKSAEIVGPGVSVVGHLFRREEI